jgi:hypothetical protein
MMDENTLKLKRQVRDYYNKRVEDRELILQIARLMGFNITKRSSDA